jgi:hypothetical protein
LRNIFLGVTTEVKVRGDTTFVTSGLGDEGFAVKAMRMAKTFAVPTPAA